MTERNKHLMNYFDAGGDLHYVAGPGCVPLPSDFNAPLFALSADLGLALDCVSVFGGVPKPVAEAILRQLDTVRAALELGLRDELPAADLKEAN